MDVLAGVKAEEILRKPLPPYDELVCEFLNEWGKALREHPEGRLYGDIVSFAFYIRKGSVDKLKQAAAITGYRIGRGLCFHIAPSNIPVNFAFTYVFGLLAGNANIVRISSKDFAQVDIICDVLKELFKNEKYDRIRKMTSLIRYDHSTEVTDMLSKMCDIRLIWGGDETIQTIRKSSIPPKSYEISFSNRYSVACLGGGSIQMLSEDEINKLASAFYNDTFLMDQNACSSPQMIYWIDATQEDKERFWHAVLKTIEKYEMSEFIASEKYTCACNDAIAQEGRGKLRKYGNKLYVISLDGDYKETPQDSCLGEFGLFCEQDIDCLDRITETVDHRVQTCTYFGIDAEELAEKVVDSGATGIDRVVPIGRALDIGVYWDGYDLVRQMSRKIEIV